MRLCESACLLVALALIGCRTAPQVPSVATPPVLLETPETSGEHPLEERLRQITIFDVRQSNPEVAVVTILIWPCDELVEPSPPLADGPFEMSLTVRQFRVRLDGAGDLRAFCEQDPGAGRLARWSGYGRDGSPMKLMTVLGTRRELERERDRMLWRS